MPHRSKNISNNNLWNIKINHLQPPLELDCQPLKSHPFSKNNLLFILVLQQPITHQLHQCKIIPWDSTRQSPRWHSWPNPINRGRWLQNNQLNYEMHPVIQFHWTTHRYLKQKKEKYLQSCHIKIHQLLPSLSINSPKRKKRNRSQKWLKKLKNYEPQKSFLESRAQILRLGSSRT